MNICRRCGQIDGAPRRRQVHVFPCLEGVDSHEWVSAMKSFTGYQTYFEQKEAREKALGFAVNFHASGATGTMGEDIMDTAQKFLDFLTPTIPEPKIHE